MTGPIPLATPSITEWEEVGTSLANALSRYLNLCTSLGTNSLQEGARSNDLVARIDSKLGSLHVSMEQKIAQARSALSKTLNDIASPVHCLPEEILVKIFAYVIYSAQYRYSKNGIYVAEMKDHLLQVYRSRYMLLGVCSRWKKAIEDRGYFWSIITIFQEHLDPQVDRDSKSWGLCREYREARNLSFDRAKNCSLDIACVFRDHFLPDIKPSTLAEYLPRIRTINIDSNSLSSTCHMINAIIQEPSALGSLSELSLCQRQDQSLYYNYATPAYSHVHLGDTARLFRFNSLLESLQVLRITGVHLRWDMLAFSNRLLKLRLEAIAFGADHTIVDNLCHALASATRLRELELVSIRSFNGSQKPSSSSRMISLPNLQSLLVDNLQLNTLLCILNWIATRSHRLTLHLTSYFRYFVGNPVSQATGTNNILWSALQRLTVHKLCIRSSLELRGQELRATVESVPMLDTLVLDGIVFTTEYYNALERQEPHGNESSSSFPSLQHLRFGRAEIADVVAFKNMLASHSQSLRQMTLGGYIRTPIPQELDERLGIEDGDKELISQLREIVPNFSLIDSDYVLPEFQQNRWQL